jgi:hypothetical protein
MCYNGDGGKDMLKADTPFYRNYKAEHLTARQISDMQDKAQKIVIGIAEISGIFANGDGSALEDECRFSVIYASAKEVSKILDDLTWDPEDVKESQQ